jgi:hypothetical protein
MNDSHLLLLTFSRTYDTNTIIYNSLLDIQGYSKLEFQIIYWNGIDLGKDVDGGYNDVYA